MLGTTLFKFLESGDRDSNPGKFALQANAVAAVPSPHNLGKEKLYLKLFIRISGLERNSFCFTN